MDSASRPDRPAAEHSGSGMSAGGSVPSDRLLTLWEGVVSRDPEHSRRYIRRFEDMRRDGADLDGEARLIDALAARGARILDAGCGPGRIGGELARRGHRVTGVDIDPALLEAARADHPGALWLHGDLAHLAALDAQLPREGFDLIVCAGNVMTFLAPGTAPDVLRGFRERLAPEGRAVIGFGSGRGYETEQFVRDAAAAGFGGIQRFATWDLRPHERDSGFLVAVLAP
ncbi:class I SAM-dependent methyltransferase [Kocuria palustris]|uniref:class I SAM-dependent methyltransferase n=1 Tax=Kocuria palustris TaxID=71999 RepID=UPI0028CB33FA|nr:class I SAM-dependent methyltransferase [Kocuria palustris]